jgi:tetratricopeptide (TPR) repeat protein
MAQILDSPRKKINPSYATHFLNYKGVVSTEYLTNFVDSEATVAVVRDPVERIPFLHYCVAPKSISFDFYAPKNQYYCSYAVDVSLKKGETFIYQSAKDFTHYFPPADSATVAANGLAIQDTFPVIDGKYRLTVLLRNSVGKEFSLLEKDVVIEGAESSGIGNLLMGYKMQNVQDNSLMAFTFQGRQLLTDPKNTFTSADTIMFFYQVENLSEDLWRRGEIRVTVRGLQAASPSEKKLTSALNRQPFRPILNLEFSLPASELVPDYYEAAISLVDGEKVIDEAKATFIVSTASALARPIILAKTLPRGRIYLQYLELAGQAEKVENRAAAEGYFQRAMSLVPADPEVAAFYCGFLMRSKNFQKALEHIEKVKADPNLQFNYFLIKGKALRELGRCEEAIPLLLEGNKIYNSDTRLLNALGYCLYKTGQISSALEALNASLRLDPRQEDIKKLVDEIRKN